VDSVYLYRYLKTIDPDVIYQRVACYQTFVAALYAKKHRKKMVWHISHDLDVKPLEIKINRNFLSRYIEKKMVEYGIRDSSHIIAQTKSQSKKMHNYYGRSANVVIPNFNKIPSNQTKKGKNINVVWIANLKKFKQPEIFVELAADLHSITGARFFIAGKQQGPKRWWKKLNEKIESTAGLYYLGVLTQNEVNNLLERSHIAVNTSKYEGFSNVFIQAWMRSVPVVSLEANPDSILTNEKIGFCSKTYNGLKKDVQKLIENSDLRVKMGKLAHDYTKTNHSLKNLHILEKALDN
jgi:glycosyltransferase involved in cell wall biosynthesis